jgi:toxin ParE1/3/4
VASYRITIRARDQLTESQFGAYQADAYAAGLIRTFGLLADFPAIGQAADDLREGI